jgi:hypothetical protein
MYSLHQLSQSTGPGWYIQPAKWTSPMALTTDWPKVFRLFSDCLANLCRMSFQLRLTGTGTWIALRDGKQIGKVECNAQHAIQFLARKDEGLTSEEKAELDKLILGLQYRQG